MTNGIEFELIDGEVLGTYYGDACRYAYVPSLRAEMDRLKSSAEGRANRYFVYQDAILRAAQETLSGAMQYMQDGYVLVAFV